MTRRLVPIALAGTVVILSVPAIAAPDFVPAPKQSFDGFVAIATPRAEVPIGALWVEGFGPVGEGAPPDNLETVRSLSALSLDEGMQLSLSLGLLSLLGIDPRYRDRVSARFTDLSVVRVRDISKLPGPKREPRIVEALKAATVTVSSELDFGIAAQSAGWSRNVVGQGGTGRTRSFALEARDMFIAIRVATPTLIRDAERELRLARHGGYLTGRLDDFLLIVRDQDSGCDQALAPQCGIPEFRIAKASSGLEEMSDWLPAGREPSAVLPLPVPVSDRRGGLYTSMRLRWIPPCAAQKADGCGRRTRLFARYEGTRLVNLKPRQGAGW